MSTPPKPTALKLLQGNPGKRELNRKEPKPLAGAPAMPAWFSSDDLATPASIYADLADQLCAMRVLTVADQQALADLADKICLLRRLRKEIYAGVCYETTTKTGSIMRRIKPEMAAFSDLSKQVRHSLADFGLTPGSRTKIQTVDEDQLDLLEEFLGGET
jgi:P27 family predicted phage terminase small subunit